MRLTLFQDDLSLTVPFFPKTPEPNPDITIVVQADLITNSTGQREYKMNNSSYKANYNHPLLLLANQKNTSYPDDPQWNVYNLGNKKSIRVVVNNNNAGPHVRLPHILGTLWSLNKSRLMVECTANAYTWP